MANKWTYIRLLIVAVGVLSSASTPSLWSAAAPPIPWWSIPIILLVMPFALLHTVRLQARNPRSASKWRYPSWHVNPFLLKEPLQFYHLAAFFCIGVGSSACVLVLFVKDSLTPVPFFVLSTGVGMWLGVRLCPIVFRDKMVVL